MHGGWHHHVKLHHNGDFLHTLHMYLDTKGRRSGANEPIALLHSEFLRDNPFDIPRPHGRAVASRYQMLGKEDGRNLSE